MGDDYILDMREYELLQAFCRERSEAAFAELVHHYAGLVYSLAKRRLANEALAEDVMQVVFIRLAKSPPRVANGGELAAWLHRITLNATVDLWRSETRRQKREQEAQAMEIVCSEDELWRELSPRLDEALNQLKDEDREILLLRFFGRKSMREIGRALAVNEDAAKMRVSRALERLRIKLGVRVATATAVGLGALLTARAVEAAPVHVVAKLELRSLPATPASASMTSLILACFWTNRVPLIIIAVGTLLAWFIYDFRSKASGHLETMELIPAQQPALVSIESIPRTPISQTVPASTAPVSPRESRKRMNFHLVDARTGRGIAIAKFAVLYRDMDAQFDSTTQSTDNTGMALILEPEAVNYEWTRMEIQVTIKGYVPQRIEFRGGPPDTGGLKTETSIPDYLSGVVIGWPADFTLRLEPALTVGGLVIDEDGVPISHALIIQERGNSPNQAEDGHLLPFPENTQDDGTWSYSFIPQSYTNEIHFLLAAPQLFGETHLTIPVDKVNLTNLVLVMNRGFTVTGTVTDSSNHPVNSARIHIRDLDPSALPSGAAGAHVNEEGEFGISGIGHVGTNHLETQQIMSTNDNGAVVIRTTSSNPIEVEIEARAFGYEPTATRLGLSEPTNTVRLTLAPEHILHGRVVDEEGRPIANAEIIPDQDVNKGIPSRYLWTFVHSNIDGEFEAKQLPDEEICYRFQAEDFEVLRQQLLRADGNVHEIKLRRRKEN